MASKIGGTRRNRLWIESPPDDDFAVRICMNFENAYDALLFGDWLRMQLDNGGTFRVEFETPRKEPSE